MKKFLKFSLFCTVCICGMILFGCSCKNNYDISFVLNNGNYTEGYLAPSDFEQLLESGLPKTENVYRKNHTFAGWFSDQNLTNKVESIDEKSPKIETFYAKWDIANYNVTFVLNGGEFTSGYENANDYVELLEMGLPSIQNIQKQNYEFLGWYSDQELTNKVESIDLTSDKVETFYAKWQMANYAIEFEIGDANYSSGYNVPTDYNSVIENGLPTKEDVIKEGYELVGWFSDDQFTNQVTDLHDLKIEKLYAKFLVKLETVNVSWTGSSLFWDYLFEASGYKVEVFNGDEKIFESTEELNTVQLNEVLSSCEQANGFVAKITALGDGESYTDSDVATSQVLHRVSFISNGRVFVNQFIIDGEQLQQLEENPMSGGSSFQGWTLTDGGYDFYTLNNKTITSSFNLYAKWSIKSMKFSDQEISVRGIAGEYYETEIAYATGGSGIFEYSIVGEKYWAEGMVSAYIYGTPTQAGTYVFQIQATDIETGNSKIANVTIIIE